MNPNYKIKRREETRYDLSIHSPHCFGMAFKSGKNQWFISAIVRRQLVKIIIYYNLKKKGKKNKINFLLVKRRRYISTEKWSVTEIQWTFGFICQTHLNACKIVQSTLLMSKYDMINSIKSSKAIKRWPSRW